MAPGRVSIESGLADWTLKQDGDRKTDSFVFGKTLARVGLTHNLEAQILWTPYARERLRARPGERVATVGGIGDLQLGFSANLKNPDGRGFSVAINPFVSVPIGVAPNGAGDWGGGILIPASYGLGGGFELQLTPEVDARVNKSGRGQHLAYSSVFGLGFQATKKLVGAIEFQAVRDEDPSGSVDQKFAALSFGWMARQNLQIDIAAVAGLNAASAPVELYVGLSRRF